MAPAPRACLGLRPRKDLLRAPNCHNIATSNTNPIPTPCYQPFAASCFTVAVGLSTPTCLGIVSLPGCMTAESS